MKIQATFRFKPFSPRQQKVLTWWLPNSPVRDMDGIIADGAIRSGKTVSMSLSYVMWAMETFAGQNFGMAGKTIGSFRRNVLFWLKLMLRSRGYGYEDHRSDNLLIVRRNGVENYFYIFGGKDERSQDLIQGITLAGMFFDEVALMPQSFVNQATGRCSVEGSKFWFNCNPQHPEHWFRKEWILQYKQKRLLYLHFTMDDNWSLSEKIKARYRAMYTGVFFKRFILGLWAVAEGLIYQLYVEDPDRFAIDRNELPRDEKTKKYLFRYIILGVDFGGNKSKHAFTATAIGKDWRHVYVLKAKKIPATGVSVEQLIRKFEIFAEEVEREYGDIDYVYPDNAEQTIINSMAQSTKYRVLGCYKGEIIDRIRCTDLLMSTNRLHLVRGECDSLDSAFKQAVWDDKKKVKDVRLDDGSYDVDPLDSFEYTISPYMRQLGGIEHE